MVTTTSTSQSAVPVRTDGPWPVLLCWMAVAVEGFDLVVLGAVIPAGSENGDLGFTDVTLTLASTIALVGAGIGARCIAALGLVVADLARAQARLVAALQVAAHGVERSLDAP